MGIKPFWSSIAIFMSFANFRYFSSFQKGKIWTSLVKSQIYVKYKSDSKSNLTHCGMGLEEAHDQRHGTRSTGHAVGFHSALHNNHLCHKCNAFNVFLPLFASYILSSQWNVLRSKSGHFLKRKVSKWSHHFLSTHFFASFFAILRIH